MDKQKEELLQTINQIYQKNIRFFKKSYPLIYNDILIFEESNQENFYLDFSDNHFELYTINGEKIYNCDPFIDSQHRVKNIDKHISGISTILFDSIKILKKTNFDAKLFVNQYIDLIPHNASHAIPKFNKFIFIGTLLGVHLNDIHNQVNADTYLIAEESIEIFRLSMFLTDYEQLSLNSKLFFHVGEDKETLTKTVQDFFKYKYEDNYFIKFEIVSEKSINLLNNITETISSLNPIIYPYSEYLENYENSLLNFYNVKNGLLNISKQLSYLKDIPILFIAAGPSLKNDINFLIKSQERFFIVAVSSVLIYLEKHNITPDVVISIDGNEEVYDLFPSNPNFLKDCIILLSLSTDHNTCKKLPNPHIYLFQTLLSVFDKNGSIDGISVGDTAIKLLLQLGATTIYFAGFDTAFDQETQETNITLHKFNEIIEESNESDFDYSNKTLTVKGNHKDSITTTIYYNMIKENINKIIKKYPNSKIYNLSDGAYFKGSIPIKSNSIEISTFNLLEKSNLKNKIINKISLEMKRELNSLDKQGLQLESNIIKNFNTYKNNKQILNNSHIGQIILQYKILIQPYLEFLYKNTNIKKSNLEKIHKKQIQIILNTFEKVLKR